MKQFIPLIVLALLVCSCVNKTDNVSQTAHKPIVVVEQPPTPAIDFHETIEDLFGKSNGKPFDLKLGCEPNSDKEDLSYKQRWAQVKYSTAQNDTLFYWFINKELFGVSVTSPKLKYSNIINHLQRTSESAFNEQDRYYTNGNNIIFIGERRDGGTFFVYLNNESDEITDLILFFKLSDNAWREFIKTNNGEVLIARFYLSLMAEMASSHASPSKYYSTILRF